MSDPLEDRLRSLMRESEQEANEHERLERVLHKAHIRGGVLDLLTLFARWGAVLSEAGNRHARRSGPSAEARDETVTAADKKE